MKSDIRIALPKKVRNILNVIQAAGHEAYVVGGCVRDSLLGRKPEDWDITTSALPEQVKVLFPHTIDTGLQHGTVTVMQGREGFEVTTYRIDGEYEDGRHPKCVTFTPSLREDLRRRDFTINAMAYNEEEGLIDRFQGLEDMDVGVIRCVGLPEDRFREDALRMLRALRFSAQLGYHIHKATENAIKKLAVNLKSVSAERIQAELVKILVSPNPDFLRGAYRFKVTAVVLPELDRAMETKQNHRHHIYSVGEHILHSLKEVAPDRVLRLTMLFHDIGKPDTLTVDEEGITRFHGHAQVSADMAKSIMRRLKFDNDTIHTVYRLVLYHDYTNDMDPDLRLVRRTMNKIGEDIFPQLFQVKRADILAQSDYRRKEKLERLKKWEELYAQVIQEKQCVSLKGLAVTGHDLTALGIKPGKGMGDILQSLLQMVLDDPECNTREKLLTEAEKLAN